MSDHTDGPWEVRGLTIWQPGKTALSIAVVTQHQPNARANARLIGAAPDLFSALEAILFQVTQGKVLERDACITQARAALAAAKGGES